MVSLRMQPPDTGTYILTRVSALNGGLLLVAIVLLLVATAGGIGVAWRTLGLNENLRRKLDWLRQANDALRKEIASYESATPAERKKTTVMPTVTAPKR